MISVALFVFGLIIGSFVNVIALRLSQGGSFVRGRSHCPACKRTLRWHELVPLVSWIFLRARCSQCKARISIRYPLVEIISGLIFVLAPSPEAILVVELLLIIALIDLDIFIIPDSLLICLLLLLPFFPSSLGWSSLWCALGLGGFFFLLWYVSKGQWIGFGDVKLAAVLGLLFGFPGSIIIVYGAILIGGFLGVLLLATRRATMKTALPFGALLGFAGIIFTLYGKEVIDTIRVYLA